MVDSIIIQRQKNVVDFIKNKSDWIVCVLLAIVVYIAVFIRTRNLKGLRDITTGSWTLGPDLDPFLFLRWAKYIVENGSLYAIDSMRYVPLGLKTGLEYPLTHYPIAWFHKIGVLFGSTSVEHTAVIYPVIMFALTIGAFFLMTRETFLAITDKKRAGFIALVACFFLSVIPVFIPRTIAGIPEKESGAFFYMFLSFYFFLLGWKQKSRIQQYAYSSIGGLFAGLMALTWGGYGYILLTMSIVMFVLFMFGQINDKKLTSYGLFIFFLYLLGFIFLPDRFNISILFRSVEGFATLVTLAILFADFVIHKYFSKYIFNKIRPYPRIASLVYGGLFFILIGTLFLGPSFIMSKVSTAYSLLGQSADSRLILTVAENRQPFFVEWSQNFGPMLKNIPLLIPLIFFASILLTYRTLCSVPLSSKYRWLLTVAWVALISAIAFTRYSPESIFNGSNILSKTVYLLGVLLITALFVFVRNKKVKDGMENPYLNISLNVVFIQIFFIMGLLSSRTFIRLVLMLVPMASMLIGYLFVISFSKVADSIRQKNIFNLKTIVCISIIVLIVFAGYSHYRGSVSLAKGYVPSAYTQQWQKAMSWVRDNTAQNAVFGHWWDYGYWIQSIGERATVLDGGNLLGYWNHMMGRYALTETDMTKTLEFLYAHNVTHFLIDSTDIGKYSAFSTIGSDSNYDRRSWIPTFLRDNSQSTERKNATVFFYNGGTPIDEDILYKENNSEIFLPEGKAYLAAVAVVVDKSDSVNEVLGIYFFQDKTYQIPLRKYWDKKTGLVDTGKGINAGIFIYPRVAINAQGGADLEPRGALLYLSPRTASSNLARFYLYGESNDNFRLVHSEEDSIAGILKAQGAELGDFVYFNEFRGPIKIWELNYPSGTKLKPEYLQTEYPENILYA
ncbi:MAG: STT3 domain-containing protein [Nanoarchaeota archaeon]